MQSSLHRRPCAGVSPEIKAFMDRAFFVAKANGDLFRHKLGAGIAAERRSGADCAVDTINHYFGISGMFTAGSRYWNNAKGLQPDDVESDEEGIDTMRQPRRKYRMVREESP